jgi:predicted ABC-type sugar transport system permease subunit
MFVGWVIVAGLTLIPVAGGIVWFAATVFGLGAIVVAMWRARRGWAAAPVGPAAVAGLGVGAVTEPLSEGAAPSIPPPPVSTDGP